MGMANVWKNSLDAAELSGMAAVWKTAAKKQRRRANELLDDIVSLRDQLVERDARRCETCLRRNSCGICAQLSMWRETVNRGADDIYCSEWYRRSD